jgi:hypothetical protein
MNVSELIAALQKMPHDLPVVFQYDDVEYGDTFVKQVEVSQETLKLTGTVYSKDVLRKSVGSNLVELPFTNKKVVLLTIGYHD